MCVQYWPASKELEENYGGISVTIMQEEELANFHIRTFRLAKKEGDVRICGKQWNFLGKYARFFACTYFVGIIINVCLSWDNIGINSLDPSAFIKLFERQIRKLN